MKKTKIPASKTRRFFAYLIDSLIIDLIIVYPFKDLLKSFNLDFNWNNLSQLTQTGNYGLLLTIGLSIGILSLLYWTLMEWKLKQTVGKMIFNIKVSSEGNLEFWQALVRNISKPINILLLVDILYMLINKTHLRLFDKLAKTEVIEVEK